MPCVTDVAQFIDALREVSLKDVLGDLRAYHDPVQCARYAMVAVALDCLAVTAAMKVCDHFFVKLQHRLPSSPHNPTACPLADVIAHRTERHLFAAGKLGITETASKIATAKTNKHARLTRARAFALDAEKNLIDFKQRLHRSRSFCCPHKLSRSSRRRARR